MATTSPQEAPRFLLLLPPAPSPLTTSSLSTAYAETITQVLQEVASHASESPKAAVLEVALACPHLVSKTKQPPPRSSLYAATQKLIAGVYGLVCSVAAKEGINVEDADGVDVRVLLVAWSGADHDDQVDAGRSPYGAVTTLRSLARSGRAWRFAFGVETAEGEAMVRAFLAAKGSDGDEVVRVPSGGSGVGREQSTSNSTSLQPSNSSGANTHHHVAVGGTFDHIHIGHKLLLTMTVFAVDDSPPQQPDHRSATIGITGDALLVNKKHREVLEPWEDRYKAVMTFVNALLDFSPPGSAGQRHVSIRDDPGPNGRSMDVSYPSGLVVKCTEIQDAFGPTITEEGISALVISAETRAGGKAVNDKRREKGWAALEVFEVDVLDAGEEAGAGAVEGFESKLSSTAIREKLVKKSRQSSL
ncbi:hypothetical protein BDY17DRAFT_79884 [Neohortaea acidophila]|uniref:Cytidyltransferase-like domain-containing protein n=1 Tax=Neohortaea acidophila TaxID=245834 RepID=A0A6A6Q3A1_9PEZI|nr:uncharacterized protein BDY17DRAFT_79884 [Neohortaea acidophila]KAF2486484.1 hypothetical protein BDY17DRAFT_79884 [Neohortaea acidophila]